MATIKYLDPETREYKSIGMGSGGTSIPASDTEPATGNYWLDTSAEGGTYYTAGETLSASTKTALGLNENATPDNAFSEINQRLAETVFNTSIESTIINVDAPDLPSVVSSLPKLLNKNLTLKVSGTLNDKLTIDGFYGSGSLYIVETNKVIGNFTLNNQVTISHCSVPIILECIKINTPTDATSRMDLIYVTYSDVYLWSCQMTGSTSTDIRCVEAGRGSNIEVGNCQMSNFNMVILAGSTGYVHVYNQSSSDVFSNNTNGVYFWYGGIVQISGATPILLGASANVNAHGGLLINASGKVV